MRLLRPWVLKTSEFSRFLLLFEFVFWFGVFFASEGIPYFSTILTVFLLFLLVWYAVCP